MVLSIRDQLIVSTVEVRLNVLYDLEVFNF